MRAQCLSEFVAELSPLPSTEEECWILYVDVASNIKGSGVGVILEGPRDMVLEQSLKFDFKASNNEAEYEALIAGLSLAKEIEATIVNCRSDSQLVTGQILGTYQAREPNLTRYLCKVNALISEFHNFAIEYIPREQNTRADLLSKLASTKKAGQHRTVIQETLLKPSIEAQEDVMVIEGGSRDWMSPIYDYLANDVILGDPKEVQKVRLLSSSYIIISDELYNRSFTGPLLKCLTKEQGEYVMGIQCASLKPSRPTSV